MLEGQENAETQDFLATSHSVTSTVVLSKVRSMATEQLVKSPVRMRTASGKPTAEASVKGIVIRLRDARTKAMN